MVSIDDFAKLELRVGRITEAEPVPKSRKLLRVQLETGSGPRQVVAGIAGAYEPESLVGRTVIFIANLTPAKLVGVESTGMSRSSSRWRIRKRRLLGQRSRELGGSAQ